jgi:hypothetical protein
MWKIKILAGGGGEEAFTTKAAKSRKGSRRAWRQF